MSYHIKVNLTTQVVTIYEDGKPIKAFLCSTAKKGKNTPTGNFKIQRVGNRVAKARHATMEGGGSYAEFLVRFHGGKCMHSVPFDKKYGHDANGRCSKSAFNKLGKIASAGCVRLARVDAQWIYENCPIGTPVTVFRAATDPLGKPPKLKATSDWDPTYSGNKKTYQLKGPTLTINKPSTIYVGDKFNVLSGVKASNPRCLEDLTKRVKASPGAIDTSKPGEYVITYTIADKYAGGTTVKKHTVEVKARNKQPVVKVKYTGKLPTLVISTKYKNKRKTHTKRWQKFLNWYFESKVLDVDGIFGSQTKYYTKKFQRNMHLVDDGIVGKLTRAAARGFVRVIKK